jgi:DivIVA domain-containing protein
MDWAEFEERRLSGFNTVRRGYDQNEVDRFLNAVSDWLQADAAHELSDREVERKLEAAGQSTARILLIAEQEAQELRRATETECAELRAKAQAAANESAERVLEIAEQEAEALRRTTDEECTELLADADAAANDTCSRAEKYATTVRAKADEDAKQTIDEARKQAREAAREEIERERAKIDAMIVELERRRDAAVEEVERLRANLLSAISQFSPHASLTEPDDGTGGRRHAPTYGPSRHANA